MRTRVLSAFGLLLAAAVSQANLVQNGGFETVTLPSQGWDLFGSIPGGWHATQGKIEVGQGGVYGVSGFEGANVLELDADGNATVAQDLSLAAGLYTLTFDFAKRGDTGDATNAFDVLWNGGVVASITPSSTAFTGATYTVAGQAGTNVLAFRGMGASDSYGGMIDKVGIQAVPEPASMAALALGALGLLRRRRKA